MKKAKMSAGFTLVELILYVAVISLVISSVSVFYLLAVQTKIKNQTMVEVEYQGNLIVGRIVRAIQSAAAVNVPDFNESGDTLSLDTEDGEVLFFDVNAGKLRITEGSGEPIDLSNSKVTVSDLVFTECSQGNSPQAISFSFDLIYENYEGRNEYDYQRHFQGGAALRN